MRRSALWRRAIPVAVVTLVTGAVGVSAATSSGYHARQVSLNDGGIWTAQANSTDPTDPGSFVGRANVQAGVIDTAVTATARPQLLQNGSHVIIHDAATGSLTSIDTALGTTGVPLLVPPLTPPPGTVASGAALTQDQEGTPAVDLNAAGEVGLGADTVGVIDQGTGKVYVFPADGLPGGPLAAQHSVARAAAGSRLVVGVDGVVHVVSPAGAIDDYDASGRRLRHTQLGADLTKVSTPGSPFTVTAVGAKAVVLDGSGGLYVEGHAGSIGSVSDSGAVLQEPGATRSTVLVETTGSLDAIDLSTGTTRVVSSAGSGPPTAPLFLAGRGCSYGAWAGSAAVPADASTTGAPARQPTVAVACDNGRHYQGVGEANPVWRENRGSALLNDEISGDNLFFDEVVPQPIDDWSQAQRPDKAGTTTTTSTTTVVNQQQAQAPSSVDHPPVAVDDNLATRPGVPLIAHVLANDTDPDGDVLAVTGLSNLPPAGSGASVSIVDGGDAVQVTPPATGFVPISFGYAIDDGRGLSSSARVTVAIHPLTENSPPQVPADEPPVTVDAGARITVDLLRDATDPDGDPVTLTDARLPAGDGSVAFTAAGLAVISPSTVGTVPLTFTLSDGRAVTAGTQSVDVLPAGSPLTPQTHDDHLQVEVGVPGTVDVLANDSDGSGGTLSLAAVGSPAGLTVDQLGGGVLGITAAAVGTTLVHYTATDGAGEASSTLRVDAVAPDPAQPITAVRDDAAVRPGTATVVPVLANDIDQAGNLLVITGVADVPAGLTVTQIEHSSLSVSTSSPLAATEDFTYTVGDGDASATGTVVVRPAPGGVDQPPVTTPVTATVRAGNAIPIDVLAHDFDPEGEAVTLQSVTPLPAGQGTVFVEAGELRYVAPATPIGSVHVTYVVADSAGNTSIGTGLVHVLPLASTNHPPQPPEVDARVFTGHQVTVVLPLLSCDPDGDVTTLVGVTPPATGGPLLGSVNAPLGVDRFTFTAGATGGTQQLAYQVRDSGGLLASGLVRIGIVPQPAVDQPPVALPDTLSIAPGAVRRVAVLANDSDPDGDPITLDPTALTQPNLAGRAAGRVAVDGSLLDVTAPTGVPEDTKLSFAYGISDGRGGTATSTVTETVTAHPVPVPPVAVDDVVSPQRAGSLVKVNVLANDSIANGTPAQAVVTVVGGPVVTVLAGGVLSFSMPASATTFAYTVTDTAGQSASAVVSVPLALGQPPVAAPDQATTAAGHPVTLAVTANDTDPQGLPLTVTSIVIATGGAAVVTGPGSVRFTPGAGFTGLGGFTYVLSDGRLSSDGTAVIHVTGAKHPPTVAGVSLRLTAGGPAVTVDLANAVTDADNAPLSFSSLTGATGGLTASLSGSRLKVSAAKTAPDAHVSLGYMVATAGGSAHGTVTVVVTPASVGPPPQALPDRVNTFAGQPVTIAPLTNDVDPLGKGLRLLSVSGGGADGTAVKSGDTVVFTPAASFHGVATLSYQAADAATPVARLFRGDISVTVIGRPDAPGLPTGTAGSHHVALTWAVPSSNGGTISGYVVSWGGGQQNCPVNACVITGLTNGHSYTFTVTATDQAGVGPASAASSPVRVDAIPGVPQSPTATPGDQRIALTWPVPATDGSAPTSYEVIASPGGTQQTVQTNAATFTGLMNGMAYTFTVDATNAAGTSDYSAPSAAATPAGVPATPAAPVGSTTPDADNVVATWTAPGSNGSPITSYTLQVFENGALRDTIAEKDTSHLTDTVAATNGDSYAFAVSATNAVGTTTYSPQSTPVTASGVPAQMGAPGTTAGDTKVPLTWTAPADNGQPIKRYEVSANGGTPVEFDQAGGTYTGLTNGDPYTFTVSACNANGCGKASAPSASVTPYGVPDAPTVTVGVAGSGSTQSVATYSWTAPNDNGSGIENYLYGLDGGSMSMTTTGTSASQTVNCGSGAHSISVAAVNKRGTGATGTAQFTAQPCNRTATIVGSTHYSGDVALTLSGYLNGTYSWSCVYQGDPNTHPANDASGTLTVSGSPSSSDGYCPLIDYGGVQGSNYVWMIVDGVRSNTYTY